MLVPKYPRKNSSIYTTLTQLFIELKQREIDIAMVLLLLSERAWSQLMTTDSRQCHWRQGARWGRCTTYSLT